MTDEPQKLYTVSEAAKILKISTRTLKRYLDADMFKFLVIVPRPERPRVLFTQHTFDQFILDYSPDAKPADRPKRVYNRTAKKYARKKKANRRKAA